MYKKSIKFVDFDGVEQVEDHYFHLNKAELAKLELSEQGGMEKKLREIVASKDGGQIIAMFEEILRLAYGQRSVDGRRFIKNDELWKEFTQTNAYEALFMELLTDADAAANFVNNLVPDVAPSDKPVVNITAPSLAPTVGTGDVAAQLASLSPEQLSALVAAAQKK